MERWAAPKGTAAPARRYGADQPSFSSTLLDAIYKSMDEPGHGDTGVEAVTAAASVAAAKKQHEASLHYGYYYKPSLAGSYRARAPGPHATTSSSSECSSYGGFSSSEAESSHHRRLRPIRTIVPGGAPAPAPDKKAKKPGASIRAKLRDLRKPASPGARLAGFLNSIFAGKRAPATAAAESACSTASSYSRSCLSKTPSTRGQAKRTVRFLDSDTESLASSTAVDRRRVPVEAVQQMLLQRMEMESDEDDDDDDESSDASSDLFELENFAAIAPAGAAFRDELPVYETTRVVLNRAIGHGYGHGRSARVV
ncbi:hypothetical protein E2562_019410 [Oryza meyeriana var. granulata]|uniref:Protein BIG GRAIN 1 n=1 Tax=Oryza meyeriana var. granulata TaxID=110450 RepID=A0A6G1DK25_9ORYZ|nr:hypothetical protein E2562_019410 [Oryza meyeriana var. granulata]